VEKLIQIGLSNAAVSAVLALLALAVSRFFRRPALAHALWVLVLLKLITPPVHLIPIEWPSPAEEALPDVASASPVTVRVQVEDPPAEEARPAAAEAGIDPDGLAAWAAEPIAIGADQPALPESVPPSDSQKADEAAHSVLTGISWTALILTGWATGSVCWLGLAAVRIGRFRRLLRFARPAPVDLQAQARELAARLGLASCPGVWMVPGRVSPMLWALAGKPRLLLPAELWRSLPEEQRTTLLAHELAHLRRLDHWVRAPELVVTCLYWWHPVVWWARRELREAEEQCCDAWVVWALPGSAKEYALALVETLDFLSVARPALPLAASGAGHIHDLRRRLTMIMRGTTPRRLTWAGFTAVLGMAALLLPVLPTWAQAPAPRDGDRSGERPRERGDDNEKRATVEKARAELAVAEAELARARAQVAQAEARLKAAQARLSEVEGRRQGGGQRMIIIITDGQGRELRRIEVPTDGQPGGGGGGGFGTIRFGPPGGGGGGVPMRPGGGGGFGGGQGGGVIMRGPGGGDNDRRIQELENKLNTILKQLEDLRKQLRPGERRPDGQRQQPPGGGDRRPREQGASGGDKRVGEIVIKELDVDPEMVKKLEEALRQLQNQGGDAEKKKLEDVLRELLKQRRKTDKPEDGDKKSEREFRREIIIERDKVPEKDKAPR
jgi:beta-lactamase regulating signal transducer with metallopeptidase domain